MLDLYFEVNIKETLEWIKIFKRDFHLMKKDNFDNLLINLDSYIWRAEVMRWDIDKIIDEAQKELERHRSKN